MRKAKNNNRDYRIERKFGSGWRYWKTLLGALHEASVVTLTAFRAVLASFHPGWGGYSLICSDRERAAEHDTTFMATLESKKVFITIPLLSILFLPLLTDPKIFGLQSYCFPVVGLDFLSLLRRYNLHLCFSGWFLASMSSGVISITFQIHK